VSIDSVLLAAGIPAEAVVVALLWWRRVYRQLPVFSAYLAWGLLSDCAMPVLQSHFAGAYIRIYLVESSLDSVLQYGVLVELAWAAPGVVIVFESAAIPPTASAAEATTVAFRKVRRSLSISFPFPSPESILCSDLYCNVGPICTP